MKAKKAALILHFVALIMIAVAPAASAQVQIDDGYIPDTLLNGPAEHLDTMHDVPANDPSRGKQIKLKKPIAQKDLTVFGTFRSFGEKILGGVQTLLSPQTIIEKIKKARHFISFDEIVSETPSFFNYYKITAHRRVPTPKYGPTTVNANHEYKGISDRQFGYCWGYATFMRFFTHVAFYDPALPRPSLKTIYRKIDRVLEGEATVFEGFANLRELTLIPEVEFYIKLAAMDLWRERAVKAESVGITLNSTRWMDFDEVEALLQNLETRTARGEFPKLIFASEIPTNPYMGMNTDIHVVPAYKVERLPNHRARIHLWDINFYAETLVKEPKFLEIDQFHGITYAPYFEEGKPYTKGSDIIGRVVIAPENDEENATMLNSLHRFCGNSKTFKYCVKPE